MNTLLKNSNVYLDKLSGSRWAYLILILFPLLIYGQNVFATYSFFDDDLLIRNRMDFYRSGGSLSQIFMHDVFLDGQSAYYRPIQVLSYWLDARIGSGNIHFFFMTNILLHSVVGCLLFLVLKRLTGVFSLSFLFTLCFITDPLFVHTVSWLPARGELLIGIFSLASIIFSQNLGVSGSFSSSTGLVIFLGAAVLTKESAVGLPLILLISIFRTPYAKKAASGIIVISLSVYTVYFLLRMNAVQMAAAGSAFDVMNIFANLRAIPELITKSILPINLSPLPRYGLPELLCGLVVLAALLIQWLHRKFWRDQSIWTFMLWIGLFFAPALAFNQSFVAYSFQYLEHRAYVPLVGFFIILAIMNKEKTKDLVAPLIVVIVAFSIYSLIYAQNYRSHEEFFARALSLNSNDPMALFNRGNARHRSGNLQSAEDDYLNALKIFPGYASASNNLGLLYSEKGDFSKAIKVFSEGLVFHPSDPRILFNKAVAELQSGQMRSGCEDLVSVITIGSDEARQIHAKYCTPEMIKKFEGKYEAP